MKIVYRLFIITILAGLCVPTIFHAMEQQEPFMCKVRNDEQERDVQREKNHALQQLGDHNKEESERQELVRKQPLNFECTDSFDVAKDGVVKQVRCVQRPSGQLIAANIGLGTESAMCVIDPQKKSWKIMRQSNYSIVLEMQENHIFTKNYPLLFNAGAAICSNIDNDCSEKIPLAKNIIRMVMEKDEQGRTWCCASVGAPYPNMVIFDMETKRIIKTMSRYRVSSVALKKMHNNRMMYAGYTDDEGLVVGYVDNDTQYIHPHLAPANEYWEYSWAHDLHLYEDKENRITIVERTIGKNHSGGSIYLHDALTGIFCGELPHQHKVRQVSVKECDGRTLVTTLSGENIITVWDVSDRNACMKITTFKSGDKISAITMYQDAMGFPGIVSAEQEKDPYGNKRNAINIWKPIGLKKIEQEVQKKLPPALANIVLGYAGSDIHAQQKAEDNVDRGQHAATNQADDDQEELQVVQASIGQPGILEGSLVSSKPFSWYKRNKKSVLYAAQALCLGAQLYATTRDGFATSRWRIISRNLTVLSAYFAWENTPHSTLVKIVGAGLTLIAGQMIAQAFYRPINPA